MCLYPKLIKNRKYIANKKNGGNIPAFSDIRVLQVPVGCGKCMECMKHKSREWQIRLNEEIKENKNGKMITLTFNTESLKELETLTKAEGYEKDNAIAKIAVRRFLERWRKKYKKSIKHWLITELGQKNTEHLHLHGIIWTNESKETIENIWKYGYITIGNGSQNWVNGKTISYITKYVTKIDQKHVYYKPIILTSPGIGKRYIEKKDYLKNKYNENKTDETYKNAQGYKMQLPIYYRNKIYSEEEREKLWIEKLDKGERFVNGRKIEKGKDETYYKILKTERARNMRLGYGNDEINWSKKRYENELRNQKYKERTKERSKKEIITPNENNIEIIIPRNTPEINEW